MWVFSLLTFKVLPLAAAGFLAEIISESDSSLLLSNTVALPRFPFFAACFGKFVSELSSSVEPLDEAGFFVAAGFFAAAAALLALAGCFLVDLPGSASEGPFACFKIQTELTSGMIQTHHQSRKGSASET